MTAAISIALVLSVLLTAEDSAGPLQGQSTEPETPLLLAHYMPWYVAKPHSAVWGWHWTMNHFDPDTVTDGRQSIASQFYPLIGPYDSGDPDVIEYHLLLMKLAGIDGVIVDWYGLSDYRDYAILHRNTQAILNQAERLGMKFAICYEDQTIPALVEAGRLPAIARVSHAQQEIRWLQEHWFAGPSYVQLTGKPVLLSFGHAGLSNEEWSECLNDLNVAYFSEHIRRDAAIGGFDWPIPKSGVPAVATFQRASREWQLSIPVAFPRFVDVYAKAGVHESYGQIADDTGHTWRTTLKAAIAANPPVIQIATWNDWGEGTQIEPSVEFGYRDLEYLQQFRRLHIDPEFAPEARDLRLPQRLLQLRHSERSDTSELDALALRISRLQIEEAHSNAATLRDKP